MTEAKPIGETLPALSETTGTTSPEPSTTLADFTTIDLTNLPKRLSDTQLAQVETVANLPLPKSSPSSDEQFAACMRSLDILPRRADDRTRAELRVKLYQRKLGVFPYHVLGQMVSKALDTCKFFPTISECLAMLPPTDSDCASIRARAKSVAEIEHQHRLDDALAMMAKRELTDWDIEQLPERWKRIGEAKGYLWAWPDGRYTVRKDTEKMTTEEIEANRADVAAMMAEWAAIREKVSAGQDIFA